MAAKLGPQWDQGTMEDCGYLAQCLAANPGITPKSCQNIHANVNPTAARGQLSGNLNITGEIGIELL